MVHRQAGNRGAPLALEKASPREGRGQPLVIPGAAHGWGRLPILRGRPSLLLSLPVWSLSTWMLGLVGKLRLIHLPGLQLRGGSALGRAVLVRQWGCLPG